MRRVSNLASPAGARPPSPACWAWAYANIHKPLGLPARIDRHNPCYGKPQFALQSISVPSCKYTRSICLILFSSIQHDTTKSFNTTTRLNAAMSLTIQHLNTDCTFLLAFSPAYNTAEEHPHRFPGAFTILIDPWLSGGSSIIHPTFQYTKHTDKPHITSLADLKQPIDLIIISQDKPDHCHRETLCSLPKNKHVNILATRAAAKKIKSWSFFDENNIHIIPPYNPHDEDSLITIALPAYTSTGSPGELTIAHLPTKYDLTKVHDAIAITYRPPSTIFSSTPSQPSQTQNKPLSLLYTPHGISPATLAPYLKSHLHPQSALPLTALIHAFSHERNPSCLGGSVVRGAPGGLELLRELGGSVQTWISAHDAPLERRGWSVKWLKSRILGREEVEGWVRERGWGTRCVEMGSGEVLRVGG